MRWPLTFGLEPSSLELLDRADYVYDFRHAFDAPGDVVFSTFFDNGLAGHVPGFRGFTWHTPPGLFDAALVDESFTYMSLRMRTTEHQPGTRLAMSIDRCSLPLGRQMLQVMEASPRPGGGCAFRWRIAVRYLPGMSPLAPAVRPLFKRMFQRMLAGVERRSLDASCPAGC